MLKNPKFRIYFDCTCGDPIGAKYATAFRDLLASSPRYEEASVSQEKPKAGEKYGTYKWTVSVVSVKADEKGSSTALSLVLEIGNYSSTNQCKFAARIPWPLAPQRRSPGYLEEVPLVGVSLGVS